MRIAKLLLLPLLFAMPVLAQDTSRVSIPKSLLTPQQLREVAVSETVGEYSFWAGRGKEIGEAVNSSLQAISEQAVNFSKTDVGKMTIQIVVIKLIGPLVVHVAGGLLIFFVGMGITLWLMRKNAVARTVLIEKTKDGKKWETLPPKEDALGYIIVMLGVALLSCAVAFSW